jgi:predicted phosphodiesterase
VVVFGHSHDPVCEVGVDGQLLVNPGSPIERRRAPTHTIAVLDLAVGRIAHAAIVDV